MERIKAKRTLKIDDFHEHWYVDRASVQVQPPILDPLPVVSRSLSGNTGSSSTKRTLSHWEQVERPVRKCTVCKQPEHNKNSLNCSIKLQQLQTASQLSATNNNSSSSSPDPFVDLPLSFNNLGLQLATPPTALPIVNNTTPSVTLTIRSPSTGHT